MGWVGVCALCMRVFCACNIHTEARALSLLRTQNGVRSCVRAVLLCVRAECECVCV